MEGKSALPWEKGLEKLQYRIRSEGEKEKTYGFNYVNRLKKDSVRLTEFYIWCSKAT